MTGLGHVYGDDRTPFLTFMQIEGSATRFSVEDFRRATDNSPKLRTLFLSYARSFAIQVSTTAVANGRSTLEQRLARWLLMVGDRLGNNFQITHEFIAVMLAVRRPGVTLAIQALEGKGLIKARRGAMHIVDRAGLIGAAGGGYGLAEKEQERLLGPKL
jgi:CRP-like cAMP-binding protein